MEYFPKVLSDLIEEYSRYVTYFVRKYNRSIIIDNENNKSLVEQERKYIRDNVFVFPILNKYSFVEFQVELSIRSINGNKECNNIQLCDNLIHSLKNQKYIFTNCCMINIDTGRKVGIRGLSDKDQSIVCVNFNNHKSYCVKDNYSYKYYINNKYKGEITTANPRYYKPDFMMSDRYIVMSNVYLDIEKEQEFQLPNNLTPICFYGNNILIGYDEDELYAINLKRNTCRLIYKHTVTIFYIKNFNKSRWCTSIIVVTPDGNAGIIIYSLKKVDAIRLDNRTKDFWVT